MRLSACSKKPARGRRWRAFEDDSRLPVAAPFGSNIGPVNAAFLPIFPDAAFDSWLTIGTTGPALIPGALSMVGLPLDDWSEDVGFCADNGAVGNARQLLLLLHLLSLLLSRTPLPLRLRMGR